VRNPLDVVPCLRAQRSEFACRDGQGDARNALTAWNHKTASRGAARRQPHYRYSDLIPPQVVDSIRVGPQVHPSSQAPIRPQS